MNIFVDVDLHQLIQSPGARSPAAPWEIKSQDTLATNIFFCSNGVVLDLGASPVLGFGLVAKTAPTVLLAYEATFAQQPDAGNGVFYQAFVEFNTTQMVAALVIASPCPCILEIRFQLADGEIVHTLDQAVTVDRTILVEGGTPAATVIAVYPDPSVLEIKTNKGIASGYAPLNSSAKIDSSFLPSTILDGAELVANKDAASGYAGLDSQSLLDADEIPVDGTTLVVAPSAIVRNGVLTSGSAAVTGLSATSDLTLGQPVSGTGVPGGTTVLSIDSGSAIHLSANATASATSSLTFTSQKLSALGPTLGVVSVTTEDFTVPAVAANVTISCATGSFAVGAYYIISGGAGVYQYISTTDTTHGVFQNTGSSVNAAAATVIVFGATIAWSGPPGVAGAAGATGAAGPSGILDPTTGATEYDDFIAYNSGHFKLGWTPYLVGSGAVSGDIYNSGTTGFGVAKLTCTAANDIAGITLGNLTDGFVRDFNTATLIFRVAINTANGSTAKLLFGSAADAGGVPVFAPSDGYFFTNTFASSAAGPYKCVNAAASTQTSVTSSVTPTAGAGFLKWFKIVLAHFGTYDFYIDGTLVTSSSTNFSSLLTCPCFWLFNGTSAVTNTVDIDYFSFNLVRSR